MTHVKDWHHFLSKYGTYVDNLRDDFDLEPPDNMDVEMTDQTNQGGNNGEDEEEEEEEEEEV
jgi:hypothetical protein